MRYERVRETGVIVSQAVLIAIGIDWDGRRQVLAVKLVNRESRSSRRDFLLGLKTRGLHGVEFVVADDHAGLRSALSEALAEAAYQRCYVHFLRNALDYVPRKSLPSRKRGSTTTVCRSCAGYTTGATSPRPAAIWQPGSQGGRRNIQSSPAGSKRISTRP